MQIKRDVSGNMYLFNVNEKKRKRKVAYSGQQHLSSLHMFLLQTSYIYPSTLSNFSNSLQSLKEDFAEAFVVSSLISSIGLQNLEETKFDVGGGAIFAKSPA